MRNGYLRDGFTLVELSLSIAFIGILSITIALIINSAISSYRRGLTLNQVNTVGMDVVDDMRSALQNSSVRSPVNDCEVIYKSNSNDVNKCVDNNGANFVSLTWNGNVSNGRMNDKVPIYGVFCTGTYTYAWNSGYLFDGKTANGNGKLVLKYGSDIKSEFRLLKIRDEDRAICISASGGYGTSPSYGASSLNNNTIEVPEGAITRYGDDDEPYDLLSGNEEGDSDLVLYDLSATAPVGNNSMHSLYYSVSFTLGTIRGGVDIRSSGDFCSPPNDYDSDFDYCAINKFNFAVQATGG